ncbi:hypothetical protein [Parabacteroides goldsteinii]|uniref:hypothetical protein n=1 Tax=Parabacteroides goldsteinii TaxID=328812 RepID=UPI0024945DBC|nr:hypothetical protein [Parabacteroides goldsteinii]
MDYNRITSLLDKYWECATTIEEERELRHFFSSDALPPELRPYKAWFLTPEAETLPPLGKEFDLKVLQQITREKSYAASVCFILFRLWGWSYWFF